MEQDKFVITGVNRLTGHREELSRPMSREEATQRLEREQANRRYQRYQPHTRLRIEKRLPVQLTIRFNQEDAAL